jgi:hypothetical protein
LRFAIRHNNPYRSMKDRKLQGWRLAVSEAQMRKEASIKIVRMPEESHHARCLFASEWF